MKSRFGKRQEVIVSMRNTRRSRGFLALVVLALVVFAGTGLARNLREVPPPEGTDARPSLIWGLHNLNNVWSVFLNFGMFGDPWGKYPSMEWPAGSGNSYLWIGTLWAGCAGEISSTTSDFGKYVSSPDYSTGWELQPSDGFPFEKLVPGPVSLEQTQYGYDDWDLVKNENPIGVRIWEENYSWGTPGYNEFIANKFVFTHHSEFGTDEPLDGFVVGIKGDCDIASADPVQNAIEDMVYYDGHAIWLRGDPDISDFDYIFQDGTTAFEQDIYTYQRNPDSPLETTEPDNIFDYLK